MNSKTPSISEWFSERNVLITGATGFMGKVLISKLLSSCPNIGNIFLLIRKKKDINPQSRLDLMLQQEPFRILRETYPERLNKLKAINGDTIVKDLSLSITDKECIINQVSVVFHMAANVKFNLSLRTAVKENTMGTMNVVELAKQMRLLVSFIHVSTSYCQCEETILEERVYRTSISPEDIISMLDKMTDEKLEAVTPKLIGNQPNTYAYSKALSEDFVSRCGLPVGIARPSIVIATLKEPVPGWVDNMNGPTGLMIGAGKGVIRSMLCNAHYSIDIVPCDMVINAMIALAWQVGLEKPTEPKFVNVTISKKNEILCGNVIEIGRKHIIANPYSTPLWYPGGRITSSKILHWLSVIFLQIIPAYLLDFLLILLRNKPFLVHVQSRVSSGIEMLQYYTMKKWIFCNNNLHNLQHQLCSLDKDTFFMDTELICWDEYILSYILGTRKYCLKDDPSTLPRARQVLMYFYIADHLIKIVFGTFILWIIYTWMISVKSVMGTLTESTEF